MQEIVKMLEIETILIDKLGFTNKKKTSSESQLIAKLLDKFELTNFSDLICKILAVTSQLETDNIITFKSKNNIPTIKNKNECDFNGFLNYDDIYSLNLENADIIPSKNLIFAEATPGDFLSLDFSRKKSVIVNFISHDGDYSPIKVDNFQNFFLSMKIEEDIPGDSSAVKKAWFSDDF